MTPASQTLGHFRDTANTKTTWYDRISALVGALCIVIGFLVLVMWLRWMASPVDAAPQHRLVETPSAPDKTDHPAGVDNDPEEPGNGVFPETEESQLSDALTAVVRSVSQVSVQLEDFEKGAITTPGTGSHLGDHRGRGPS